MHGIQPRSEPRVDTAGRVSVCLCVRHRRMCVCSVDDSIVKDDSMHSGRGSGQGEFVVLDARWNHLGFILKSLVPGPHPRD